MATITETILGDVEYETPVYRKIGEETFIKVYEANKLLLVTTTAGFERVENLSFPCSRVPNISTTDASIEEDFETAATSAIAAIEEVITPTP